MNNVNTQKENKSLYQYKTINNFTINALLNDKLWLSNPNKFNDPYDTCFSVNLNELVKKITDTDETLIDYLREEFNADSTEIGELEVEIFKPMIKRDPNKYISHFYELINDKIKKFKDCFLVGCFTTNYNSEIMWAHYGNLGKGIVIEYDSYDVEYACSIYEDNVKAMKVNYDINNIKPDYTDLILELIKQQNNINYIKEYKNVLNNKRNVWSYEDEVRIAIPNTYKKDYFDIAIKKPKAIYLGENISSNDKNLIQSICKEKNINVYQMNSSYTNESFGLKAIKIEK